MGVSIMPISWKGIGHKEHLEEHRMEGSKLRELILGGQDGLVNVLGLVLGVAGATSDTRIVVVAGLAALAAESISMAAVAYTSEKAAKAYYESELEREKREVEETPEEEREEIRRIYAEKGFKGRDLERAVKVITSDKGLWVDVMMKEELGLHERSNSPFSDALLVGFATVIGAAVPLLPFLLAPVASAIWVSVAFTCVVLFLVGAYKARVTAGSWVKAGLEMAAIGFAAAMLGYWIGAAVGASPLFS